MSKVTYFFQHRKDKTWVIPITHSSAYKATQELKNHDGVKPDEWRLVKITETTFCNRSVASIESSYYAMSPKEEP